MSLKEKWPLQTEILRWKMGKTSYISTNRINDDDFCDENLRSQIEFVSKAQISCSVFNICIMKFLMCY